MSTFPPRRRADPAGLTVALLLFLVAGAIVFDLRSLSSAASYGPGPAAMPAVVASGLVILGIANLVLAFRGAEDREHLDLRPIALILGGLVVLIASIGLGGGFVVATAVMFAATATAFGRTAPLVDFGIGLVLAAVIYVVFSKLLSLSLPAGPLERLI